MTDQLWQAVRYFLLLGGGYLAGKGVIPSNQVAGLVDQIMNLLPGAVALGAAIWGFVVKFRTATVPAATAARPDVPTVSAATGAVKA